MPERNMIAGPDGETGIEPKIMQVLCVLASEPGRVFSRAELIDKVWGTEFGADESLTRAISLLRKALGDTRSEPAISKPSPSAVTGFCLRRWSWMYRRFPGMSRVLSAAALARGRWCCDGRPAVLWWLKPARKPPFPLSCCR